MRNARKTADPDFYDPRTMFQPRIRPQHSLEVSPSPGVVPIPAPDLIDAKLTKITLNNGVSCYVVIGPNVRRFFGACVNTPAISSRGEQHVLEHMIVSGSRRFPSQNIYRELHHASDCVPGACTYHNKTWYYGSAHSEGGFREVTDFIVDGIFNPLLTVEAFETEAYRLRRERIRGRTPITYPAGVVFNEMRQSYLHPQNMAMRNAVAHLFPEALPQMDFAGSPDGLQRLQHKNILKYHNRFYYPENAVYFVAHPTSAAPALRLLESLKPSGKNHNFEPPEFDMSRGHEVHCTYPAIPGITGYNSNLVILIPTEKAHSIKEFIFYNVLWDSLFYLDRNKYTSRWQKTSVKGRCMVSTCAPITLGSQHFLAIQVDKLAPEDQDVVKDLILTSYQRVNERNVPLSTFESALGGVRHFYNTASNAAEDAFWPLTEEIDTYPEFNLLTRGAVAQEMLKNSKSIYPEFCRFVEKIFNRTPLVFKQDPAPVKVPRKHLGVPHQPKQLDESPRPLQVNVPDYDLHTKRIARTATHALQVRYPFKDENERIASVPIGDQNRIHLNIGFDLSVLPQDLWMHAIFLLNTLGENRSKFRSASHVAMEFNKLASAANNQVLPVTTVGCYFFVGVSVFPHDFKRFLDVLGKVFNSPDYTKASYLHGLEYQRDSLYPDIFDPSASDGLSDAFITRALAYFDRGYRQREALVGFEALPKFNRILSAWSHDNFSESERRMYRAINYLFSGSALSFQFSAPESMEDDVAQQLRSFYDAQRRWDKRYIYETSRKLARNDILIAPSVTNIAARVFQLPNFSPEHEVALGWLTGFVISKELNAARGFYRNFVRFDPTTLCLILMAQRGSSASAPFKVYDSLPGILAGAGAELSRRQIKGLTTAAVTHHLERLSDPDPHSRMIRRIRLDNFGIGAQNFAEYCDRILLATQRSFAELGDMLAAGQPRARNLILTGKEGAREVRSNLKRLHFGKPLICNM